MYLTRFVVCGMILISNRNLKPSKIKKRRDVVVPKYLPHLLGIAIVSFMVAVGIAIYLWG